MIRKRLPKAQLKSQSRNGAKMDRNMRPGLILTSLLTAGRSGRMTHKVRMLTTVMAKGTRNIIRSEDWVYWVIQLPAKVPAVDVMPSMPATRPCIRTGMMSGKMGRQAACMALKPA